jgi:hypothetical protein
MIKNIIDLLQLKDYFGVSKEVDIAKGMYQIPKTVKDGVNQIKRVYHGR